MPEYNIKVQFEQKTFSFLCSEDQDIISAAKMNGIDLPSSCCSGVCTDCASMDAQSVQTPEQQLLGKSIPFIFAAEIIS